ncbi:uncharacterized protein [Dermacentor albipictus]|uniref:uncharacterized protein isoform X2 n=1 Tax=Dermacentor albipictus TaxID=60249 RepID=UPI0031FCDBE9
MTSSPRNWFYCSIFHLQWALLSLLTSNFLPLQRLSMSALVAQMRLMAGDSFILFFGLTFVNTRGRFPADKTAEVIKGITSNVNLVIVRSDRVETGACNPQPLSVWKPVRGHPSAIASTITHSKLILKNLANLRRTIVAMSSNMALKVYNVVANRLIDSSNMSQGNSSEDDVSGRIACSVEILCIAELCNLTGWEENGAGKEKPNGARYESYTGAQNITIIRTYETQSTIVHTLNRTWIKTRDSFQKCSHLCRLCLSSSPFMATESCLSRTCSRICQRRAKQYLDGLWLT